jgi:hypothetical protein
MVPLVVHRHVDVDDVALLERAAVGDTVADDLVDGDAAGPAALRAVQPHASRLLTTQPPTDAWDALFRCWDGVQGEAPQRDQGTRDRCSREPRLGAFQDGHASACTAAGSRQTVAPPSLTWERCSNYRGRGRRPQPASPHEPTQRRGGAAVAAEACGVGTCWHARGQRGRRGGPAARLA